MIVDARIREAEATLLRIHDAMGGGDEGLLDDLNDVFTRMSLGMTESQLRAFNGLSADLYSLRDEEARFPASRLGLGAPNIALKNALNDADWWGVLLALRSVELRVPEDRIAYLRGLSYARLGFEAASSRFYAAARALRPGDASYLYLTLASLRDNSPEEALQLARDITAREGGDWKSLALSYWVQMRDQILREQEVETRLVVEARDAVSEATTIETMLREEPAVASATLIMLGFWHELLGENESAHGRYLDASLIDPASREAKDLLHGATIVPANDRGDRDETIERATQAVQGKLNRELALAA